MAHRRPATRIGSIPRRMVGGIAAYRGPFRPSPEVRSEPQNGHAQRRQNDGNGERGEWPDGHKIGLPKFRWVTSRRGRKKERGLLVRLRNRRMNLVMRITASETLAVLRASLGNLSSTTTAGGSRFRKRNYVVADSPCAQQNNLSTIATGCSGQTAQGSCCVSDLRARPASDSFLRPDFINSGGP